MGLADRLKRRSINHQCEHNDSVGHTPTRRQNTSSTLLKLRAIQSLATLVIGPPGEGCMFAQSLGIVTLVTLAWIIVSLVAG
jgi:hypothetical protein